jgi:hypothetical protein
VAAAAGVWLGVALGARAGAGAGAVEGAAVGVKSFAVEACFCALGWPAVLPCSSAAWQSRTCYSFFRFYSGSNVLLLRHIESQPRLVCSA